MAGGNNDLFQYLISKGAGSSVSLADEEVSCNHMSLQLTWPSLLDMSAGSTVSVVQDWTPLHSAVSAGHTAIVQALISGGADVNAANSSGQTPLHYAVGFRSVMHFKQATLLTNVCIQCCFGCSTSLQ